MKTTAITGLLAGLALTTNAQSLDAATVRGCHEKGFAGDCWDIKVESGVCKTLPNEANDKIKSINVGDLSCRVFENADCTGDSMGVLGARPGLPNLYRNKISSVQCWDPNTNLRTNDIARRSRSTKRSTKAGSTSSGGSQKLKRDPNAEPSDSEVGDAVKKIFNVLSGEGWPNDEAFKRQSGALGTIAANLPLPRPRTANRHRAKRSPEPAPSDSDSDNKERLAKIAQQALEVMKQNEAARFGANVVGGNNLNIVASVRAGLEAAAQHWDLPKKGSKAKRSPEAFASPSDSEPDRDGLAKIAQQALEVMKQNEAARFGASSVGGNNLQITAAVRAGLEAAAQRWDLPKKGSKAKRSPEPEASPSDSEFDRDGLAKIAQQALEVMKQNEAARFGAKAVGGNNLQITATVRAGLEAAAERWDLPKKGSKAKRSSRKSADLRGEEGDSIDPFYDPDFRSWYYEDGANSPAYRRRARRHVNTSDRVAMDRRAIPAAVEESNQSDADDSDYEETFFTTKRSLSQR